MTTILTSTRGASAFTQAGPYEEMIGLLVSILTKKNRRKSGVR